MEKEKIVIGTEFIRLDALLKFSGVAATGGQAKQLIAQGDVCLNGVPAAERGKKIRPGDVVSAGGRTFEVCSRAPT